MAYSKGMKTRSEARREAMTRVLENMTPKVLVVDEIGTKGEAQAARTIGERGVQLVATAHGHNLSDLLSNTDLRDLAGGIMTSTVGDANERYKASGRKTVSERSCRPVFYTLIEIRSPISVAIHTDLARSVDVALMGQSLTVQVRSRDEEGQMWVEWQKM
ncbi:ycf45 [Symbiodinium necroappetens]|uniref:Ycf45 protein n=1 Tax=Symbiodinium necroappetens TaxID=1628268 RepID=A0A812M8F2_9DINO|nr:ycf45 [Symbiodinium necroappetens]CAE7938186.1 ycf45 [Symbiodinium sp. KB8]